MSVKISGSIITYQEAHQIEDCLKGLFAFCDEVVVADMGSPDGTAERAEKAGARVVTIPRHTCLAPVRALVTAQLKYDWVYNADADERVPLAMGRRVRETLESDPSPAVYLVPLKHIIFGRRLRHCGLTNDHGFLTLPRCFHKSAMKMKDAIHQEFQPLCTPRPLWSNVEEMEQLAHEHYWSPSINHFIEKMARYTDNESRPSQHLRSHKLITSPLKDFFRRYLFQKGYRDGSLGFEICGMMATYQFYRVLKNRNPDYVGRFIETNQ